MAKIEARVLSASSPEMPGPTFVALRLTQCSRDEYGIKISPQLPSDREIDEQVD